MRFFASLQPDHSIDGKECHQLAARVIDGSNPQEEPPAPVYFPGDHLFTPLDRRRGLPIGNQTSQFFANVYLNPLDQFVHRELKCGPGSYLRYVDDFLLFGDSKVAGLRLRVHEANSNSAPVLRH